MDPYSPSKKIEEPVATGPEVKLCAGLIALNAVFWFAKVSIAGVSLGLLLIALAGALLKWPRQVRWGLIFFPVIVGAFGVALLHHLFRSVPNYGFLLAGVFSSLAYVVLLFGQFNPFKVAGAALFVGLSAWYAVNPTKGSHLAPDECSDRVVLLASRLEPYRTHLEISHQASIPSVSGARQLEAWRAVFDFRRNWKAFGPHQGEMGPLAVRSALQEFNQAHRQGNPREPQLTMFFDAGLSVEDIAPYLEAAPRMRLFAAARLKSEYDPARIPEGAEEIATAFGDRYEERRSEEVWEMLNTRVAPCRGIGRRYNEISSAPPELRAGILIDGAVEGLAECGCSWINIDQLEYLLVQMLADGRRPYAEVELPRNEDGSFAIPKDKEELVGVWLQKLAVSAKGAE